MAGELIRTVVAVHTPRMAWEEIVPDFAKAFIDGLYELGEELRGLKPDVFVVNTAHWITSFLWFITSHERHLGECIADEAPTLFKPIPYDRKGDPELAAAIAAEMQGSGIPAETQAVAQFRLDYATVIPLKYIDPNSEIPVVSIGTCVTADIDECLKAGGAIRRAIETSGRRAIFIGSNALSHKMARVPSQWPSKAFQEMDQHFIELFKQGRVAELKKWMPTFASDAQVEVGGRVNATMLGTLDENAPAKYQGTQYGPYGQSSGTGNVTLLMEPAG